MHNFVKAIIVCCLLIIIGGCLYYTQQKGQGIEKEEGKIKELFQGESNPVSDLQGYSAYDPYTSAYGPGIGQGGGLDRKDGGGSLRNKPPTGEGCYVYSDGNCPRRRWQGAYRRWHRDTWGERYRNARCNPASCLARRQAYNAWCGSSDYKVVHNSAPPSQECSNNKPYGILVPPSANFGKIKGPWISWSGKPIHGFVWPALVEDDDTNTGIAVVHDGYWIKMAKFDRDGNPICNSGRYYRSHQARMTDTITSLYKKGYNARNNYEFVRGSNFCIKEYNSDPGCALDRAAFVAEKDKLIEERDMFDVSFNHFKNQFELKDTALKDCRLTVSGDGASYLTDLETLRSTHRGEINSITTDRDNLKTRNKEIEGELLKKDDLIGELQTDLMKEQVCCESKTTTLENTENQLIKTENELDAAVADINLFEEIPLSS